MKVILTEKITKINDKRILIMSPEDTLKDGINYPSHASWSFIDFNKDKIWLG